MNRLNRGATGFGSCAVRDAAARRAWKARGAVRGSMDAIIEIEEVIVQESVC